jgi:hypothetical protein
VTHDIETAGDEEAGGICVHCLLDRVRDLVAKIADAWWCEEFDEAQGDVVNDTLAELTDLLFEDPDSPSGSEIH